MLLLFGLAVVLPLGITYITSKFACELLKAIARVTCILLIAVLFVSCGTFIVL